MRWVRVNPTTGMRSARYPLTRMEANMEEWNGLSVSTPLQSLSLLLLSAPHRHRSRRDDVPSLRTTFYSFPPIFFENGGAINSSIPLSQLFPWWNTSMPDGILSRSTKARLPFVPASASRSSRRMTLMTTAGGRCVRSLGVCLIFVKTFCAGPQLSGRGWPFP